MLVQAVALGAMAAVDNTPAWALGAVSLAGVPGQIGLGWLSDRIGREIVWAIGLKHTEGFTRLWPSVITVAAMVVSMYLLALAVRTIPVGTGYAVWTGIGAVGVAILGMILFDEPKDLIRVGSILLIVTGIAGLKFASP